MERAFPAVVCAAVALTAYFQTRGIAALLGVSIAAPADAPALPHVQKDGDALPSAAAILARNPFDSATGPLDAKPDPGGPSPNQAPPPPRNPLEDPQCEVAWVTLISASDDPAWSFANIEEKDGRGQKLLRRMGDAVGDHTVAYIAWNRVWLQHDGSRCQMLLGDKPNHVKKKSRRRPRKPARRPRRGRLPADIAAKIKKIGPAEYNIDRSAVDEILEDQVQLMRGTRTRPIKKNGEVTGMRVSMRSGSLLHRLGMRRGDILHSINGFELTDPQRALEAYGRLRTSEQFVIELTRKGKPMSIDVHIQ